MALALRLSKRNLGRCWPNPCVGAVIVADGREKVIVGEGCTGSGGRPHGERVALGQAGEKARGATLYVTLEPCSHHGKTPPCTEAIIAAGIKRVMYALKDPDPRVAGSGIAALEAAGIEVDHTSETMRKAVNRGARAHIKRVLTGRPFVQLKLAVGSDGRMKPGTGAPVWVTGEQARARGHLLRARADAILVGKGTVLADNPSLTCRLPGLEDRSPVRILLDSKLATPTSAKLVETAKETPVWIFAKPPVGPFRRKILETRGTRIFQVAEDDKTGHVGLEEVLECLGQEGITRLLVEGGPHVARSFLDADLVDEIYLFAGHGAAGPDGIDPLAGLGLEHITNNPIWIKAAEQSLGEDRMTVFRKA